jgi:hypothetical protein
MQNDRWEIRLRSDLPPAMIWTIQNNLKNGEWAIRTLGKWRITADTELCREARDFRVGHKSEVSLAWRFQGDALSSVSLVGGTLPTSAFDLLHKSAMMARRWWRGFPPWASGTSCDWCDITFPLKCTRENFFSSRWNKSVPDQFR